MQDYQTRLEKFRKDVAEFTAIRDRATDPKKREIFDLMAQHLARLADAIEKDMPQTSDGENSN